MSYKTDDLVTKLHNMSWLRGPPRYRESPRSTISQTRSQLKPSLPKRDDYNICLTYSTKSPSSDYDGKNSECSLHQSRTDDEEDDFPRQSSSSRNGSLNNSLEDHGMSFAEKYTRQKSSLKNYDPHNNIENHQVSFAEKYSRLLDYKEKLLTIEKVTEQKERELINSIRLNNVQKSPSTFLQNHPFFKKLVQESNSLEDEHQRYDNKTWNEAGYSTSNQNVNNVQINKNSQDLKKAALALQNLIYGQKQSYLKFENNNSFSHDYKKVISDNSNTFIYFGENQNVQYTRGSSPNSSLDQSLTSNQLSSTIKPLNLVLCSNCRSTILQPNYSMNTYKLSPSASSNSSQLMYNQVMCTNTSMSECIPVSDLPYSWMPNLNYNNTNQGMVQGNDNYDKSKELNMLYKTIISLFNRLAEVENQK